MGSIVSKLAFPYPPKEHSADALAHRSRSNQLVFLTTASKLRIPAVDIRRPDSEFTILYSHGNAEDVGLSLQILDAMSACCGCSVFAYEYPGYSVSDGEPSETNCYEAADAAYRFLTVEARIDPSRVVVFGRSLGTGPAVDLCSRIPDIGGCILQSPLESAIRCAVGNFASYALYPVDIFRSHQKIGSVACPVLIMHGEIDRVVPIGNGRALYAQLQGRPCHQEMAYDPVWMQSRGHNDMPQDLCLGHCKKFLQFLHDRGAGSLKKSDRGNILPW